MARVVSSMHIQMEGEGPAAAPVGRLGNAVIVDQADGMSASYSLIVLAADGGKPTARRRQPEQITCEGQYARRLALSQGETRGALSYLAIPN
jgi:hypothetical protein